MKPKFKAGDLVHRGGDEYLFITRIEKINGSEQFVYFYDIRVPHIELVREKQLFSICIDNMYSLE